VSYLTGNPAYGRENGQNPLPLSEHNATFVRVAVAPRREEGTGITAQPERDRIERLTEKGRCRTVGIANQSPTLEGNCMPEVGGGTVQLLDVDPDLVRGLDPRRAREAGQRLYARVIDIPRGRWDPGAGLIEGSRPIGLLILEGVLVREATVGDHPSAELLGPGDLLRAWDDADTEELLPRTIDWSALTATRAAVIDHAFAVRAAQWPEVFAALIDRAARRAERLVVLQAIAHLTRVDDRLLALLWCLAERWGRVVPGGVLVSLRLSHRTLAGMIGARRPSVTTALGQLMARGELVRRPDGEWLLRGEAPEARSTGVAADPVRFERQLRA
jgi:CRP/FNR family cyclic AMP-dependent transcriptional regulator